MRSYEQEAIENYYSFNNLETSANTVPNGNSICKSHPKRGISKQGDAKMSLKVKN